MEKEHGPRKGGPRPGEKMPWQGIPRDMEPVVQRFSQQRFETADGHQMMYSLFEPEHAPGEKLPMVVFMHDMGACSADAKRTLTQGIGALVWAQEAEQKKRPCYVLAPQYEDKAAFDDFTVGWEAEATVELIRHVSGSHDVDERRIYGTGQSMGTMMLCELLIRHDDVFAACYLTAGQWDPARMAAIRDRNVWIMVSEGDGRAFPIMGECMAAVEAAGGRVARGHVSAKATDEEFAVFASDVLAQGARVQFTWLDGESVLEPDTPRFPAACHVHTWKWAYRIEPVRAWLFEQRL